MRTRRGLLAYSDSDTRIEADFRSPAWRAATAVHLPPRPIGDVAVTLACAMSATHLAAVAAASAGSSHVADTSEAFAAADGPALLAQLDYLDIFAPSLAETRVLLPGIDDDALRELTERCPLVVQKRGSLGLAWYRRGGDIRHRRPLAGPVVDPTGAGDSVVGALAVGLAFGLDDERLLDLALRTAALVVSGLGTEGLGLPLAHGRRG